MIKVTHIETFKALISSINTVIPSKGLKFILTFSKILHIFNSFIRKIFRTEKIVLISNVIIHKPNY